MTTEEYHALLQKAARQKVTPITAAPARQRKYRNNPKAIDGYYFDSSGEARRYMQLRLLEKAGEIANLSVHDKYELWVSEKLITSYEADFVYIENGEVVVEDYKGVRTPVYIIKKALMKALYGVDIRETGDSH